MSDQTVVGLRLFARWVRATWMGWLLGLPLIIVAALIGEGIGIGGSQALVGAGMGTGIGLMQGRAIRVLLDRSAPWFFSCVIGLAAPFVLWDFGNAVGWNLGYSLYLYVALGGLIVGIWQAFILHGRFFRAGWWVVGSVVGWTLASGTAALADSITRSQSIRGLLGAFIYLGVVASGGLALGIVTGAAMVWGLRERAA